MNDGEANPPPRTMPEGLGVDLRGFESEERAKAFGFVTAECVGEISRHINLASLEGVTVAFDYPQALRELDRGYDEKSELSPSQGSVVGIAMTPSVLRGDVLKSHIVLNAPYVISLENIDSEFYGLALQTLAHECAHVNVTAAFNTCFPGVLPKKKFQSRHDAIRWDIALACWDEFAATSLSAWIGENPAPAYEQIFLQSLAVARSDANMAINAFRLDRDFGRVVPEVLRSYGELMKHACYLLGTMDGLGQTVEDLPNTHAALDGHWFQPYFSRLAEACLAIAAQYGRWEDTRTFDAIGDIAEAILEEGGMLLKRSPEGGLLALFPLTRVAKPR